MKKKIQQPNTNLAKFKSSEIAALTSISGGNKAGGASSTIGYDTVSSDTDFDKGDHDSDTGNN